jgi:hypothetical protein
MDRIVTFKNENGLQCSVFKSGRGYVASLSDGHRFRGQGYFQTFDRAVSAAENWVSTVERPAERETNGV